ncbi:hypothetical protein J5491_03360 [Candidatus Saccharibacteria bacterium]|nr:hypothetical protein [Candidatus Saccharibacteria bacterium]
MEKHEGKYGRMEFNKETGEVKKIDPVPLEFGTEESDIDEIGAKLGGHPVEDDIPEEAPEVVEASKELEDWLKNWFETVEREEEEKRELFPEMAVKPFLEEKKDGDVCLYFNPEYYKPEEAEELLEDLCLGLLIMRWISNYNICFWGGEMRLSFNPIFARLEEKENAKDCTLNVASMLPRR